MTVLDPIWSLSEPEPGRIPDRFKNLWEEGMIEKIQAVK